jgi:5-methyltetrahydrofolate--homocysteine methyltransferase
MNLAEFVLNSQDVILIDGAMGTQLAEKGAEMGGKSNLTHPDAVLAVHQSYINCGVDMIITNTLTMNRIFIEVHKVGIDVREVNLTGVRLAKTAAKGGQYVLGDISTSGVLLKPSGKLTEEEAFKSFKEQAELLAEGGVDGFLIETMIDLKETLIAIRACKEAAGLPVLVTMSFNMIRNEGRTVMGNKARDCAKALTDAGAFAIGANCGGITPLQMAEIAVSIKEVSSLPLITQPNAGIPQISNGQTIFNMPPADFVTGIQQCIKSGAKLVGGCCGTSPAHIRAVAEMLGKKVC